MEKKREIFELELNSILPNRFQPRITFEEKSINELAQSIKKYGVIQPIVVRQIANKYEIIAGERRYKASGIAGKTTIPAIIYELTDNESVEVALLENIQRENLTPIEKAISYKKILDINYLSQEQLAQKIGKSQSSIANTLRLLTLSDEVQEALLRSMISERHARSLLKLKNEKDQNDMLERITKERLTVRRLDEEIIDFMEGNNQIVEIPDIELEENSEIELPNEIVSNDIQEEIKEEIPDYMNNPLFFNESQILNNPISPSESFLVETEIPVENETLEDNENSNDGIVTPTETQEEIPDEMEGIEGTEENKFFDFFSTELDEEEPEDEIVIQNGQQAIYKSVYEIPQEEVVEEVKEEIKTYDFPIYDSTVKIEDTVPTLEETIQEEMVIPTYNVFENSDFDPNQIQTLDINNDDNMPNQEVPTFEQPPMQQELPTYQAPTFEQPPMQQELPTYQAPTFEQPPMQQEVPTYQAPTFEQPPMQQELPTYQAQTFEEPVMQSTFTEIGIPELNIDQNQLIDQGNIENVIPNYNPISNTMPINTPTYQMVDPIPFVDNTEKKEEIEITSKNVKDAINVVRNSKSGIEQQGFSVDMEEIDFENSYQIIIKIDK